MRGEPSPYGCWNVLVKNDSHRCAPGAKLFGVLTRNRWEFSQKPFEAVAILQIIKKVPEQVHVRLEKRVSRPSARDPDETGLGITLTIRMP